MTHKAIPLYRKVIALMMSVYLLTTLIVRMDTLPEVTVGVAVVAVALILAVALVINFVLKSPAATVSLIVLLAVVSVVSALVLIVLLAAIGSLMSAPSIREYTVSDGGGAWSSDFSAIPVDPRTNLPIGHVGSDPFKSFP